MNPWMLARAEVVGSHHPAQRVREASLRIGEEGRDAGERLLFFGVKHMQDGADQQGVSGLLPMRPPLQRTFRIDQDVGDVLGGPRPVPCAPPGAGCSGQNANRSG
jgi:hypothetical protein